MSKPIRILLVEDSEPDAALLLLELRRGGYDPSHERLETRQAMADALKRESWDLIICDYVMPQFDGPSALDVLKESGLDIPFIIVSGSIAEGTAVAAMKAGADDYVMKSNLPRLVPAIQRELEEAIGRQARRRAEESLRESEALKGAMLAAALDGIITIDHEGKIVEFNPAAERMFGCHRAEVIGQSLSELIIPAYLREKYRQAMTSYLTGHGAVLGKPMEMPAQHADGKQFTVELGIARIALEGPPMFTAYIHDISDRKKAEEMLKKRARQYAMLAELCQRALRISDLQKLFDQTVGLLAQALEAECCFLEEVIPGRDGLLLRAGTGCNGDLVGHAVSGMGTNSQAGFTLLSETPTVVDDLQTEKRFQPSPWLLTLRVISGATVLMQGRESEMGVLSVFTTRPRAFAAEEVQLLQAAANVLAAAAQRHVDADAIR